MCEITTAVICPHCQGVNVVKNGHKKDGTQNFSCKSCRKQFQFRKYLVNELLAVCPNFA